jgi:hypothetical protein
MVTFENQPTPNRRTVTEIESDPDPEADGEQGPDAEPEPSVLDRLADFGERVSNALSPFTEVLTVLVQFYTVKRVFA